VQHGSQLQIGRRETVQGDEVADLVSGDAMTRRRRRALLA
jgi:hypothetical protein